MWAFNGDEGAGYKVIGASISDNTNNSFDFYEPLVFGPRTYFYIVIDKLERSQTLSVKAEGYNVRTDLERVTPGRYADNRSHAHISKVKKIHNRKSQKVLKPWRMQDEGKSKHNRNY